MYSLDLIYRDITYNQNDAKERIMFKLLHKHEFESFQHRPHYR